MFDALAGRYDLMNDILSMGKVRLWRQRVKRILAPLPGERVLDPGGRDGHVLSGVRRGRGGLRRLRLLVRHADVGQGTAAGGREAAGGWRVDGRRGPLQGVGGSTGA